MLCISLEWPCFVFVHFAATHQATLSPSERRCRMQRTCPCFHHLEVTCSRKPKKIHFYVGTLCTHGLGLLPRQHTRKKATNARQVGKVADGFRVFRESQSEVVARRQGRRGRVGGTSTPGPSSAAATPLSHRAPARVSRRFPPSARIPACRQHWSPKC